MCRSCTSALCNGCFFKKLVAPNDIQLFCCSIPPLCVHREWFVLSYLCVATSVIAVFAPFVIAPFAPSATAVTHNHFLIFLIFFFFRQACITCWLRELAHLCNSVCVMELSQVRCLMLKNKIYSAPLHQCFSTFVRPRAVKFFFHKTRARSQQIYS
jgi:hypothetical protein